MTPTNFPQSNCEFGPPEDLDENQCKKIQAHMCQAVGGSCDGVKLVVVAWMPNEKEYEDIATGKPIYLTMLGGLPPHFLTTDFEQAIKPA